MKKLQVVTVEDFNELAKAILDFSESSYGLKDKFTVRFFEGDDEVEVDKIVVEVEKQE